MVFVYRAAIVAFATFGECYRRFCPAMASAGSLRCRVQGDDRLSRGTCRALLSIVLGLLIWTSHGLFAEQQSQLLTVGAALIRFDYALKGYGPEAAGGRALLREHAKHTYQRFWTHARDGRYAYADLDRDVEAMRVFSPRFVRQ
jgi:hypothetical protein